MSGSRSSRVWFVISSLDAGGAERQVVEISRRLRERGIDIEIVTLTHRGTLAARLDATGVQVTCVLPEGQQSWSGRGSRLKRGAIAALNLWSKLERDRPNVVVAWLPHAQMLALPAAWLTRVPARIMAIRSMRAAARVGRWWDVAFRLCAAASETAVFNGAAALKDPNWKLGATPRILIPNGVRIPAEAADPSVSPPRFVYVANLLSGKGHERLLRGLAASRTRPSVDLIGGGPLRAQLEELSSQLGLQECVRFLGPQIDAREVLGRYQGGLLLSDSEGMPNAVLEMMAAGLPIIGGDVAGIREVLSPEFAVLVQGDDPQEVGHALDLLTRGACLRESLGQAARVAATGYSWDNVVSAYEDLLASRECEREQGESPNRRRPQ